MAPGGGSKRRRRPGPSGLTPDRASLNLRVMRAALLLSLVPAASLAQAPPSADLWRVAATSLTGPAALEAGPTGVFWNPAAERGLSRLGVGGEVIETSDVVGLSGFVVGVRHVVRPWLTLGVVVARLEVRDLVRTTTSPASELGSIPVFEQMAGLSVGSGIGPVRLGGLLRVHDARFDALDESGATVDVGLRLTLGPRLTLAAATHFLPVNLTSQSTTDYYMGAEYVFLRSSSVAGAPLRIVGRYGASYRPTGDLEHGFGVGAILGERLHVDAMLVGESAFGRRAWRPALGVVLEVGRYRVAVARGSGLRDLGATYRIGLDVAVLR